MPTRLPLHHRQLVSAALAALTLLLIIATASQSVAATIEEPEYVVLETFGDVEVRRYGPTIQAYTSMENGGFRNLAGYIFGGNSDNQEIAMTAPVATTVGDTAGEMAFTLPAVWTMENLPSPDDTNVRLREMPAFTAAVVSFSGWARSGAYLKQWEKLSQQLYEREITPVGEPILNQYDPPWKLPFMRRNEVMVAIEWPVQQTLHQQVETPPEVPQPAS